MIKYNELTVTDSLASRPHKRHRAVVSKVKAPHQNGTMKILDSQVAVTVCGRYVGWFTDASDTSLLFQDGNVYAVECVGCFGRPLCAQCAANAQTNEAGGYYELAEKCREYCRRGHRD